MRTLYLDCSMGAAGDMLMAALLELHPDPDAILRKLNGLGLPGVGIHAGPAERCGIKGTHVLVKVDDADGEYSPHKRLEDIKALVREFPVSDKVKSDVMSVYGIIAGAESHVHGSPAEKIHFHEVGNMDAVADITGACLLMEELSPGRVLASPVNTGSGQVRCAHGILPVPAPATAYILRDVPIYNTIAHGELCTPTGAALLKHFASGFGPMPVMKVTKIGYGMGKKVPDTANCLRAFMGETEELGDAADEISDHEISELSCNLDDMTPEGIGFVQELLFENGALDVYTIPIGMKKSRPGVMLTCMCRKDRAADMLAIIFRHTTTLGVREHISRRYILHREEEVVRTKLGDVKIKKSSGRGVERSKPEYEDIARIVRENNLTLADVVKMLRDSL